MGKKKRRRFKPEEKFKIVKEGVTKSLSVSEICEKYDIHPNQFYQWQKKFLEGALDGFRSSSKGRSKAAAKREKARKEAEMQRMKNVIADLAAENIALKKNDTI